MTTMYRPAVALVRRCCCYYCYLLAGSTAVWQTGSIRVVEDGALCYYLLVLVPCALCLTPVLVLVPPLPLPLVLVLVLVLALVVLVRMRSYYSRYLDTYYVPSSGGETKPRARVQGTFATCPIHLGTYVASSVSLTLHVLRTYCLPPSRASLWPLCACVRACATSQSLVEQ